MAKTTTKGAEVSDLEALASRLDAMGQEATELGEERVAKSIGNAAKSARWADKQRQARRQRVGKLVQGMQEKGLTPEQIVAELTR
jgi:hypothetical protein